MNFVNVLTRAAEARLQHRDVAYIVFDGDEPVPYATKEALLKAIIGGHHDGLEDIKTPCGQSVTREIADAVACKALSEGDTVTSPILDWLRDATPLDSDDIALLQGLDPDEEREATRGDEIREARKYD
jgi:hypothetical protein